MAKLNKAWLAGRGLLDLIKEGYPESVAKRIISDALPMDEASRLARKEARGGIDTFHSTTKNFNEVDPSKVDLGIHSGTKDQAEMRMRDTARNATFDSRDIDAADFPFDEGSNVMPLNIAGNNILEMNDVGAWENPLTVTESLLFHPKFAKDKAYLEDMYTRANDTLEQVGGDYDRLLQVPEVRSQLDELNNFIRGKGYDTIQYENTVENIYGSSAGYTPQAQSLVDALDAQLKKIDNDLQYGKGAPRLPKPSDVDYDKSMEEYINWTAPKMLEREAIQKQLIDIRSNPDNLMDTSSYISLDPSNVRSANAAFDPEYKGSNILGSRIAPTAATGLIGASALMGTDDAEASYLPMAVQAAGQSDLSGEANLGRDFGTVASLLDLIMPLVGETLKPQMMGDAELTDEQRKRGYFKQGLL